MDFDDVLNILSYVVIGTIFVAIIGGLFWGAPHYGVYRQKMKGMAILAHAQSSREVAVVEAKAKMESAELLAQAEITRARGVASANKIIGESLNQNESYLRYLWIQNMSGQQKEVVYIPTEANLPILEARSRNGK